jgi:hypothetical protein
MRYTWKQIQNIQKPKVKLSDEQIRRLDNAGFKWITYFAFEKHFNELMAFKANHGNCDVPLERWCSQQRYSYTKIQNNQKPKVKLMDEQIRRLNDAGFNWSRQKGGCKSTFDERFNELMAFKAKHRNFNVYLTDEYAEYTSPSNWCEEMRCSYKKIHHNQKAKRNLSDEQI